MTRPSSALLSGLGCLCTACLYTGPIPTPPEGGFAPEITFALPEEKTVLLTEAGQKFEILYEDDDPGDYAQIEVQWELNRFPQGNGNTIYIYPQDLGPNSLGTLLVTVTDPSGRDDDYYWNLTVAE